MRPVCRGRAPRRYAKYHDAIGDLEGRLGTYCSYCERRLPTSLAVEHVVPKSGNRKLEKSWTNFLLACVNCNSAKKAKRTNNRDFLWPDKDNTFRAFAYAKGGIVDVAAGLTPRVAAKAGKLRRLVGLQRHPGQARKADTPAPRDKRWLQREEVWTAATKLRGDLDRNKTKEMREAIVVAATGYGYFSVWMTAFRGDKAIRRRLVEAFKGTAKNCFDKKWTPVRRPGGRL